MTELKPCPFCGGEADLHWRSEGRRERRIFVYAACDICGAQTRTFETTTDPDSEDFWDCLEAQRAMKLWNSRKRGHRP